MDKQPDQSEFLVKRALKILEMPYKEEADLNSLLDRLDNAVLFPATQTERKISVLTKKIVEAIRNKSDVAVVTGLLDQLNSEFVFSILD